MTTEIPRVIDHPAFPSMLANGPQFVGLSILAYFAARAPAEPQPWFAPVMPPQPKGFWKGDNGMTYETQHAAERACGRDGYESTVWAETQAWPDDRDKQRYIQWPFAWAEAVLSKAVELDPVADGEKDAAG